MYPGVQQGRPNDPDSIELSDDLVEGLAAEELAEQAEESDEKAEPVTPSGEKIPERVSRQRVLRAINTKGPVSLGDLALEIFGVDSPTNRQRLSYHVRKLGSEGDIVASGSMDNRRYSPKRKQKEAKAPAAPSVNPEVGDLYEYIGLTGEGKGVIRSITNQRLFRIDPI